MIVYTCADRFEDMMTVIYDAWASRRGHENVRLEVEPIRQQELFCEYIHIDGDEEKAEKVIRSVKTKISEYAFRQIFYAAHSQAEDRLDAIFRFLIIGFREGRKVTEMLTEQSVVRVFELGRKVGNEAHFFREFARFTSVENQVYVAHIEPKSDILIMTAEHFTDRMPSEYWIMVDDNRRKAAIHPKNEPFYMQELTDSEFDQLRSAEYLKDRFTDLWKEFFRTIGIKERENPVCQRNMMPLWYRKHMTEFLDPES